MGRVGVVAGRGGRGGGYAGPDPAVPRRLVHRTGDSRGPGGVLRRRLVCRAGYGGSYPVFEVGSRGFRPASGELRALRPAGGVHRKQPGPRGLHGRRRPAGPHGRVSRAGPVGRGGGVFPRVRGRHKVPRFLHLRGGPDRAAVLSRSLLPGWASETWPAASGAACTSSRSSALWPSSQHSCWAKKSSAAGPGSWARACWRSATPRYGGPGTRPAR